MTNYIFYESLLPEKQNGFHHDEFAFFKGKLKHVSVVR